MIKSLSPSFLSFLQKISYVLCTFQRTAGGRKLLTLGYTVKKRLAIFLFPAGMNFLIIPRQGEFGYSDIPIGEGKIAKLFYNVVTSLDYFAYA
jgi:hypothetical protein